MSNNIIEDMPKTSSPLCIPPDNRCEPDPRGMGVVFYEKMKQHAHKIAQIDAITGEKMMHGEVLLRSIRVAQKLKKYGVTQEDIISLCTDNHMNSCVPYLACLYLKVRIASVDPTLSQGDTSYLLGLVCPKMIFCDSQSEELIERSLTEANLKADIVVFGDTSRNIPFADFLVYTGDEYHFKPDPVNDQFDTAIIFFSSGTTGLPKGICATHYGILSNNTYLGLDRNVSKMLYFTSLYWISGTMLLTCSIMNAGARIICPKFDEKTIFKYVEMYKVTITFFSPTLTYKLTLNPNAHLYDTTSLQCVIVGGGPLGGEQMLKLRKLLPHTIVSNMYGMTETAGIVTMFSLKTDIAMLNTKLTSSGKPIAGFSYKVVDPETDKVLGSNQRGELRVKGKCVMSGYHNKLEESARAWDSEGYLCTGDIAYYDEDFCFYIVDRIKDMLKYQSWHIAPAEIESVILTHPQVKSAVVVGLPHEVNGDMPMGVVVLVPGATVTENDMVAYVNKRVSDRKHLRAGVKFVDNIPQTPSGKLRRRDVRNWVLNKLI